jgi:hypothetical protein
MAGYSVQEGHNCQPKDNDWNGPEPCKVVTASNNYWERHSENDNMHKSSIMLHATKSLSTRHLWQSLQLNSYTDQTWHS